MKRHLFLIPLIVLGALLLSACGSSVERTLDKGNRAFSDGQFEDALVDYSEAAEMEPSIAEPIYNLANTLYRLGAFEEAGGLLARASEMASEMLAENSFYNLGNNFFQQQQMEASIEAYKEALRLDPNDMDAKYNLELAMLQQEQQQQEQQEQNQENNAENQSEQKEAQGENEQNQSEANEGDQEPEPESQNPSNQEETPQDQGDQSGDGQSQQVEGLTEEQARQLLAAIGQATETLQEKLEEIQGFIGQPPAKDW